MFDTPEFNTVMLFVFGLILLIKGGDWFVDSASGIARRFHIPELIIGATIVSIGTTLPEVMVSATSAANGLGDMAYGNAIGSIICNTALIAAITIAVRPPKVERKTFTLPVVFFFIAAVFYMIVAYFFNEFSRGVGIALLAIFVIYMAVTITVTVRSERQPRPLLSGVNASESAGESENIQTNPNAETDITNSQITTAEATASAENITAENTSDGEQNTQPAQTETQAAPTQSASEAKAQNDNPGSEKQGAWPLIKDIIFLIIGAALIAVGANLLVNNGQKIAVWMGVPESVIALTFVALGTSLPELVTAITSLIKGHGSLSLGNVIGANLFNLVLVSGISIVISPFAVPSQQTIFGVNASLIIDLPVMLFVMAFMTLPALLRGKLSRWQGITLLAIYLAFCILQFAL